METEKKGAEHLTFMVFGAIMTGAVAWAKPSIVAEQWRAWVFLLLNLILLVILFNSSKNADKKTNVDCKKDAKKIDEAIIASKSEANEDEMANELDSKEGQGCLDGRKYEDDELNERVEAFIVMFRQHLVADAKITKHGQLCAV